MTQKNPVNPLLALTVAGSDSSGGAGIQADLKTFWAFGVYGTSVVTSVTAQNTVGIQGVYDLPAEFVALQMESVFSDIGVDAAKTGMLRNSAIIRTVSRKIKEYRLKNLVVDPVMAAGSGYPLLREDAIGPLRDDLFPLARVVTPNLLEAQTLTGIERINDLPEMEETAKLIKEMGSEFVLIKGGHLRGETAVDLLFDGQRFWQFESERFKTRGIHGTGCTLSAAITAGLAQGLEVPEAVKQAKDWVSKAIKSSLNIGQGQRILQIYSPNLR